MKYLKSFESLRTDFTNKLKEIENEKISALNTIKNKVDVIMYDILDEYQEHNYDDSINPVFFKIEYKNIKFKWDENLKIIYDFIDTLDRLSNRIKSEFDVNVRIRSFLFDKDGNQLGSPDGFSNLKELRERVDLVGKHIKPPIYDYIKIEIEIT